MIKGTMSRYWVGIDTGGTFTDVVIADTATGRYRFRKVPSNPADPAEAILRGLDTIMADAGVSGAELGFVGLGTTLATNAVLEGKTGRTAMLVTRGFTDVLELARQRRPHLYNLAIPKPRLPTSPADRIEVTERLDADGLVVTELDAEALQAQLATLDPAVEAVAICFLHAYRNPAHERQAAELLRRHLPAVPLCLSSEVNPEFREYERFSTTAVNASLLPVMDRYLERFSLGVAERGVASAPFAIQSSGGLVSPATLRRLPINTFFSGPAGGVVGAARVAAAIGVRDIITFDIGGTSTDVCLVKNGVPARAVQQEMAGLPVRTPSIDLHTIGAGGGSIAWVDAGGLPKVGPQSAGARPGPAAYGLGGTLPTVTDANMVLGRLNPVALLDGTMPVSAERAHAAVDSGVAQPLGLSVTEAAAGILEIANLNISGAVRVISVERGEDPRDYALFAFGGGGPLHAAEVAETMDMRQVIVPAHPGLMSALGLLAADIRGDFGQTCLAPANAEGLAAILAARAELDARGRRWIADEGLDPGQARFAWSLELRYAGQSSDLSLPIADFALTELTLAEVVTDFHRRHAERFGYAMPERKVEAVTLRLVAVVPRPEPPEELPGEAIMARAPERRAVWFRAVGFIDTPVLDRRGLTVGERLRGPLVIEQMDTTTIVPPGWLARHDSLGNLILEKEAGA
ncbi:MAG: hypothetical protein JWR10_1879 [Rubritepida sp.]|nr:hypothetical protein [Rubritepida sp.]